MAEFMFEDLKEYVNKKFPEGVSLTEEERENLRHKLTARNLTRVYLANESNFMQLDKFVSEENEAPLVVVGNPGSGKSALLANWLLRHKVFYFSCMSRYTFQEHHPEDVIVAHYIGCSPASTNYISLLIRITNQVKNCLLNCLFF